MKKYLAVLLFVFPLQSFGSISGYILNQANKYGYSTCAIPLQKVTKFLDGISSGNHSYIRTAPMDNKNEGFRASIFMKGNHNGYSTISTVFAVPLNNDTCSVNYSFTTYLPSTICLSAATKLQKKFSHSRVGSNGDGGVYWNFYSKGRIITFNQIPGGACYFVKTGGTTFYSDGNVDHK